MYGVKIERPPVLDVIHRHQQAYGTSQDQASTSMIGSNGASLTSSKPPTDDEERFQIIFEEMEKGVVVPCVWDTVAKEKLIPVKVANAKICSVYPNAQQNSEAHSELRKPLCTRSIKSDALLEIYNNLLQFHCAHEYGSDFVLEPSDRFVIFEDFANYYSCVRRAFPHVSADTNHRVHDEEVLPIQGGFLILGKIICPYILRSNIALLPLQIVRVAGFGSIVHSLLKDCLCSLKGWLASPRELAFLTEKCQKHNLPLVFGRDTRLVPLPQMRSLFKGKPGFDVLTFPEKDDASDQHRTVPSALANNMRLRQHLFGGGSGTVHHFTQSSLNMRYVAPGHPAAQAAPQVFINPPTSGVYVHSQPAVEAPLNSWNLQQLSNLPPAETNSSSARQPKRRRVEKASSNYSQAPSCTGTVTV